MPLIKYFAFAQTSKNCKVLVKSCQRCTEIYSKYLFPRAMNSLQTCKQKAVLVRLNIQPKKSRKTKLFITWKTTCLLPKLNGFILMVVSLLVSGSAVRVSVMMLSGDQRNDFLRCQKSNTGLHWPRCLVKTALLQSLLTVVMTVECKIKKSYT